MAQVPPIPSASVSTAVTVKIGAFLNCLRAYRKLPTAFCIATLQPVKTGDLGIGYTASAGPLRACDEIERRLECRRNIFDRQAPPHRREMRGAKVWTVTLSVTARKSA